MNRQLLPVGIDDFEKVRQKGYYYVDKTSLIKDLLQNLGEVNLFTRPRRFGKTLNMSMLQCFFEIGRDASLFEGLRIAEEAEICNQYMGQYPVVSISLKTVEGKDYEDARVELCSVIGNEALRFRFLLDSPYLFEEDKEQYRQLIRMDLTGDGKFAITQGVLTQSLYTLTVLLHKHYHKKAIVLIDEYDVPLAKAKDGGYYKEMIGTIRTMFHAALKTNTNLEFAVMTGCLRIAKESIFTGLNNLKVFTMLDDRFEEQFGFTDAEVRQLLADYEQSEYYDLTKEWYDGYRIGDADVYNPWDVIYWCDQLCHSRNKTPQSYWANSSGNTQVRRFIRRMGNDVTRTEMERLVSGESVSKRIVEQLTYDTMYDSIDNLWSLLFATGYLTKSGESLEDGVNLVIPNMEVRQIFTDSLLELFRDEVRGDDALLASFCLALQDGDAPEVEKLLGTYMKHTISIRDTMIQTKFKESFYHGIMLGILSFRKGWNVYSNVQSGEGYCDIAVLIENDEEDQETGIVIEMKYATGGNLDAACEAALHQINEKNYTQCLVDEDANPIRKYGIAFYRRKCRVVAETEENGASA